MRISQLKTIDIQTLTWFDKVSGNTYFANVITLNYGLPTCETINQGFRYGYSGFDYKAYEAIKEHFKKDKEFSLYDYIDKKNIVVRHSIIDSLKRELKNI